MKWFNKKEEIPTLLKGLIHLKVGKKYSDTEWSIDLDGCKPHNDLFQFEIYEIKRYQNDYSEIRILSVKNNKSVDFNTKTSYIVKSKDINWLMYDTINLFNEYQQLKNNKVGLNFDFHKSLEEFKSVKV